MSKNYTAIGRNFCFASKENFLSFFDFLSGREFLSYDFEEMRKWVTFEMIWEFDWGRISLAVEMKRQNLSSCQPAHSPMHPTQMSHRKSRLRCNVFCGIISLRCFYVHFSQSILSRVFRYPAQCITRHICKIIDADVMTISWSGEKSQQVMK